MYLGLDLGTSGLRAVFGTAEGEVLAEAEAALSTRHPYPGWSEQDPESWVTACQQEINFGISRHRFAVNY